MAMGDLKSRFSSARTKLLRRGSGTSTSAKSIASSPAASKVHTNNVGRAHSLTKLPEISTHDVRDGERENEQSKKMSQSVELPKPKLDDYRPRSSRSAAGPGPGSFSSRDRQSHDQHRSSVVTAPSPTKAIDHTHPAVTLEEPTPDLLAVDEQQAELGQSPPQASPAEAAVDSDAPSPLRSSGNTTRTNSRQTPPGVIRKQSLVTASNARIIKTLLESESSPSLGGLGAPDDFGSGPATFNAGMMYRKIWVRRPNASATLVQIKEDDLVDDVRETILKKYTNSLGKTFDSPDVTLRIYPREDSGKNADRILGPEEEMCRTLDAYYPDGQSVNEALLIEVPQRRTPRPSPRAMPHGSAYYYHTDDHSRPLENAQEYFPPMPIVHPSPAAMTSGSHDSRNSMQVPHASHSTHSIAVLQTGQLPPLPSPGSTRRGHRPKYPRHNTASPTAFAGGVPPSVTAVRMPNRPRQDSNASEQQHQAQANAPIPTPPAPDGNMVRQNSTPPTPRVASPRPGKRKKQKGAETPSLPSGLLDGSVPPINVLIVEDNIINLRVLGAFMQRLKVRWQRAMNGKEAVTKWRAGGFHLVLMDIQLPVMNGLEATKEIRRLERVNGIGVFSSGSAEAPNQKLADRANASNDVGEEDKLGDSSLFKSPVIIVALTASSLQSDRHEALAAGCNDFLTKPVNFVWLERKVKEWGCMQALIDYDGWRKWKDYGAQSETTANTANLSASFSTTAPRSKIKTGSSPTSATNPSGTSFSGPTNGSSGTAKTPRESLKERRRSIVGPAPVAEETETPPPEGDSSGS